MEEGRMSEERVELIILVTVGRRTGRHFSGAR
jgi:hypothetical protein